MDNHLKLLKKHCRENGMRLTPQRMEIFRAIDGVRDHPSAYEVFTRVRTLHPTISLDTVYRTLEIFEQWGLVAKLQFLSDKIRYDSDLSVHHHMICSKCKKIWDFKWDEFDKIKLPADISRWGKPDKKDVLIQGVCLDCEKKEKN